MAIRVRWDGTKYVALCAAEFPAEESDLYLHDGIDHAIREKIYNDYVLEGIITLRKAGK